MCGAKGSAQVFAKHNGKNIVAIFTMNPLPPSMVMFAAAVAAGMAASTGVRVPTAETLAAARALRGMAASKALRPVPAAVEILRRGPAAKRMEAARVRGLSGRSRKSLARKPRRPLPEIAALIGCGLRAIAGLPA